MARIISAMDHCFIYQQIHTFSATAVEDTNDQYLQWMNCEKTYGEGWVRRICNCTVVHTNSLRSPSEQVVPPSGASKYERCVNIFCRYDRDGFFTLSAKRGMTDMVRPGGSAGWMIESVNRNSLKSQEINPQTPLDPMSDLTEDRPYSSSNKSKQRTS